jgi:hypothetical protein
MKPITVAKKALAQIIVVSDDVDVDEIAAEALAVLARTDARETKEKPSLRKKK